MENSGVNLSCCRHLLPLPRVYDDLPHAKNKFENLPDVVDEFLGLSIIIRAKVFDDFIKQFIQKFPRASVVNFGCGLDTTFYRIDNESNQVFQLLPLYNVKQSVSRRAKDDKNRLRGSPFFRHRPLDRGPWGTIFRCCDG